MIAAQGQQAAATATSVRSEAPAPAGTALPETPPKSPEGEESPCSFAMWLLRSHGSVTTDSNLETMVRRLRREPGPRSRLVFKDREGGGGA